MGFIGDTSGYETRWCYQSQEPAEAAYLEWKSRNFSDEPIGWHKHPGSDRYRDPLTTDDVLARTSVLL